MTLHNNTIIIGGGVAGLTAALYSARAGKSTLVFENNILGGVTATLNDIANYPGMPNASGFELTENLAKQALSFGAQIIYTQIQKVDLQKKEIYADNLKYTADKVILAMGAGSKKLGLANEAELTGSGISFCATCDGAFFKGKDVAVYGSGKTAIDDILYLSPIVNKVYAVVPNSELKVTNGRINELKNITFLYNNKITALEVNQNTLALGGISVTNDKGKTEQLKVSAVFVALGYTPNNALVYGQLELDKNGYIIVNDKMQTRVNGVYAVGDIRANSIKQIVAAASDGAVASK